MLPHKSFCLPISKLHSILAVANLLAHNNISQICYCGQILLQSAAVNCSFSDNLTPLGVTFILLVMVHGKQCWGIGRLPFPTPSTELSLGMKTLKIEIRVIDSFCYQNEFLKLLFLLILYIFSSNIRIFIAYSCNTCDIKS